MDYIELAIFSRNETNLFDLIRHQRSLVLENDNSLHKHNLVILYQTPEEHFGHLPNKEYSLQLIFDYLLNTTVWHNYELNLFESVVNYIYEDKFQRFSMILSNKTLLNEQIMCLFQEGILLIQQDQHTPGIDKALKARDIMMFSQDTNSYNQYDEALKNSWGNNFGDYSI